MAGRSPATDFSVALLGELIATGIRDIVLSPGSRSQALGLAAAEYERAGIARLRVRIDERVAGFLALGIAVETRMPVLIITTSGTAVANLHPAVLEAHHSGVPLILLTADRPRELRGIGSNQTTDQLGIFGSSVHFVRDVEAPSSGSFAGDYPGELAREAFSAAMGHSAGAGPVQLNLAFREPLSAAVDRADLLGPPRDSPARLATGLGHSGPASHVLDLADAPGTVVVAGHDAGQEAEELARELGAPLLAEITSGARFGPNLVAAYRELLNDPEFGGRVRRAIVYGHPTLSREIPALLQRTDVETIVVRGRGSEDYNPGHRAAALVDAVRYTGLPADRSWAGGWTQASRKALDAATAAAETGKASTPAGFARAQLAAFRAPVSRRMLVEAVWSATWPHDRLVLGASRLIRDLDRVAPGRRVRVHANRGLAGIDGTIATATGIALASQATSELGITRLLLGDLALLHDVGAMLFGGGEHRPRLQILVGNDGGGTIFDGLEVADTADPGAFDRVLYTPHAAKLAALADAYGWQYRQAANRGELDQALAASAGTVLVEVPLAR